MEPSTGTGEECGNPHEVLFAVRRSIRYHNRRRRFFDNLNKWSGFLKVASGSATITTVLAKMGPAAITISASIVAVLSAGDLIFQTSQMARLHGDLAKRFNTLEREITVAEAGQISKRALAEFSGKRLEIEADEPPIMRNLDSICYNELVHAMGLDRTYLVPMKWYQRLFAQFLSLREHEVRRDLPA